MMGSPCIPTIDGCSVARPWRSGEYSYSPRSFVPKTDFCERKKVQGVELKVEQRSRRFRTCLCMRYTPVDGDGGFYEPSVASLEADHGADIHPDFNILGGGSGLGGITESMEERRLRPRWHN